MGCCLSTWTHSCRVSVASSLDKGLLKRCSPDVVLPALYPFPYNTLTREADGTHTLYAADGTPCRISFYRVTARGFAYVLTLHPGGGQAAAESQHKFTFETTEVGSCTLEQRIIIKQLRNWKVPPMLLAKATQPGVADEEMQRLAELLSKRDAKGLRRSNSMKRAAERMADIAKGTADVAKRGAETAIDAARRATTSSAMSPSRRVGSARSPFANSPVGRNSHPQNLY